MSPPILAVWMFAGSMGVAGVALLLGVFMRDPSRSKAMVRAAQSHAGGCPCCGYSTEGLEDNRCPECGMGFEHSAGRRERRNRRGRLIAGLSAISFAAIGIPTADAARFGIAHALPNIGLVEALAWRPSAHAIFESELRARTDAGTLRPWERRRLARACQAILIGESDQATRRSAAGLLAHIAPEVSNATLARMLADRDPDVRMEGAQAVGRAGRGRADAWTRRALASMACSDRCTLVRKRAVDAMRSLGDGETQSALTQALLDPNDGVRERALIALWCGPYAKGVAEAAAMAVAGDDDEHVRWTAIWVLEQIAERHRAALGMG